MSTRHPTGGSSQSQPQPEQKAASSGKEDQVQQDIDKAQEDLEKLQAEVWEAKQKLEKAKKDQQKELSEQLKQEVEKEKKDLEKVQEQVGKIQKKIADQKEKQQAKLPASPEEQRERVEEEQKTTQSMTALQKNLETVQHQVENLQKMVTPVPQAAPTSVVSRGGVPNTMTKVLRVTIAAAGQTEVPHGIPQVPSSVYVGSTSATSGTGAGPTVSINTASAPPNGLDATYVYIFSSGAGVVDLVVGF